MLILKTQENKKGENHGGLHLKKNSVFRFILWLVAIVTLGLFLLDKIGLTLFIIIYLLFIIGTIYLDIVVKKKNKERE